MRNIIITLCAICTLFACSKEDTSNANNNTPSTNASKFIGKWVEYSDNNKKWYIKGVGGDTFQLSYAYYNSGVLQDSFENFKGFVYSQNSNVAMFPQENDQKATHYSRVNGQLVNISSQYAFLDQYDFHYVNATTLTNSNGYKLDKR